MCRGHSAWLSPHPVVRDLFPLQLTENDFHNDINPSNLVAGFGGQNNKNKHKHTLKNPQLSLCRPYVFSSLKEGSSGYEIPDLTRRQTFSGSADALAMKLASRRHDQQHRRCFKGGPEIPFWHPQVWDGGDGLGQARRPVSGREFQPLTPKEQKNLARRHQPDWAGQPRDLGKLVRPGDRGNYSVNGNSNGSSRGFGVLKDGGGMNVTGGKKNMSTSFSGTNDDYSPDDGAPIGNTEPKKAKTQQGKKDKEQSQKSKPESKKPNPKPENLRT